MQRIGAVVRKQNFIPAFGYLVIEQDGFSVFNGGMGIRYGKKWMTPPMQSLVASNGTIVLPEALAFLGTYSRLEKIGSLDVDKDNSEVVISYLGGKGRVRIPALVGDAIGALPHQNIPWQDPQDKEGSIPLGEIFKEAQNLITHEGDGLYGDRMGVYLKDGHVSTFDYSLFASSTNKLDYPDLHIPTPLFRLGYNGIERMKLVKNEKDKYLFWIGQDIQYASVIKSEDVVLPAITNLKELFMGGSAHGVSFDTTSGVWRRASHLSKAVVTFSIQNGAITVGIGKQWNEQIGQTEAPNAEFMTRSSLLRRWVTQTSGHKLSQTENGSWYLAGTTRAGLEVHAVLTDAARPIREQEANAENSALKAAKEATGEATSSDSEIAGDGESIPTSL